MYKPLTIGDVYASVADRKPITIEDHRDVAQIYLSYPDLTKELVRKSGPKCDLRGTTATLQELDDLDLKSRMFSDSDFTSMQGENGHIWFDRMSYVLSALKQTGYHISKSVDPVRGKEFGQKGRMDVTYEQMMERVSDEQTNPKRDSHIFRSAAFASDVFNCPEILNPSFRSIFDKNNEWRRARVAITDFMYDGRRDVDNMYRHPQVPELQAFTNKAFEMLERRKEIDEKRIARDEEPIHIILRNKKAQRSDLPEKDAQIIAPKREYSIEY